MKLRRTKLFHNLGIFTGVLILVLILIISIVAPRVNTQTPPVISTSYTLIPKPTATPSATSSLSQTPQKLSGFCQYAPVLLYHHIQPLSLTEQNGQKNLTVDPKYFEEQLQYLNSRGYTTLNAGELAQALISHQKLGGKNLVVTIDDGYQDIYTYAYPIIQKYHIIVNLMIPTGLLNNPGYLSWDQLREMIGSGLVFAYNHTWSHASLGLATREKIQLEIGTAKKQLEENLGKPVNIFAYPYGSESSEVINVLRSNGFIAAFSTNPGFMQCDSFLLNLRRNRIGNSPLSTYGL